MITINKNIIELAKEKSKIYSHIMVVVDYKQEEAYSSISLKLSHEVQNLSSDLSPKDIDAIINIASDSEVDTLYLYDSDEIIEVLFPAEEGKNNMLQSAYNWIESEARISWIVNNALSANYWYNIIDNVNDNYILSTQKLKRLGY